MEHLEQHYPTTLLGHCCGLLSRDTPENQSDITKNLSSSLGAFYFPLQVLSHSAFQSGDLEGALDLGTKALKYLAEAENAYGMSTKKYGLSFLCLCSIS
jgi:hypothetical protein